MGELQLRRLPFDRAGIDEVDVDGAGSPMFMAHAAQALFDGLQGAEQVGRRQRRPDGSRRVYECGLVRFAPGLCQIKGRDLDKARPRNLRYGAQRLAQALSPVTKVGAETQVTNIAHDCSRSRVMVTDMSRKCSGMGEAGLCRVSVTRCTSG